MRLCYNIKTYLSCSWKSLRSLAQLRVLKINGLILSGRHYAGAEISRSLIWLIPTCILGTIQTSQTFQLSFPSCTRSDLDNVTISGINRLVNPKKFFISLTVLGTGKPVTAATFLSLGLTPSGYALYTQSL